MRQTAMALAAATITAASWVASTQGVCVKLPRNFNLGRNRVSLVVPEFAPTDTIADCLKAAYGEPIVPDRSYLPR